MKLMRQEAASQPRKHRPEASPFDVSAVKQLVTQADALQGQKRLNQLHLSGVGSNGFGHTPCRDYDRRLLVRPLLLDPPDDTVDRVNRAVEHSRPDTFVCPARDDPFGRDDVSGGGGWGPPKQRIRPG